MVGAMGKKRGGDERIYKGLGLGHQADDDLCHFLIRPFILDNTLLYLNPLPPLGREPQF